MICSSTSPRTPNNLLLVKESFHYVVVMVLNDIVSRGTADDYEQQQPSVSPHGHRCAEQSSDMDVYCTINNILCAFNAFFP